MRFALWPKAAVEMPKSPAEILEENIKNLKLELEGQFKMYMKNRPIDKGTFSYSATNDPKNAFMQAEREKFKVGIQEKFGLILKNSLELNDLTQEKDPETLSAEVKTEYQKILFDLIAAPYLDENPKMAPAQKEKYLEIDRPNGLTMAQEEVNDVFTPVVKIDNKDNVVDLDEFRIKKQSM